MNKTLRNELEALREMEDNRQLVMVANNTPLQKLVCVWPAIGLTEAKTLKRPKPKANESTSRRLTWLWSHFDVDFHQLEMAVGVGPDVSDLFNQARFSLLVWPDGTIHAEVGKYLHKVAQAAVAIPNSGRPAWNPVQHNDRDG